MASREADGLFSTLILIPARGGSKRLPGKNLRPLGGRSLLAHTADAVIGAGLDAPVLLSTDDDAIAEEGRRFGWLVPFRRPAALAGDDAATVDAVIHALDGYEREAGRDPDLVMVLQPTSPFRGSGCLVEAHRLLQERSDIDSVIAMSACHLPPFRHFVSDADGYARPIGADASAPVYRPNGALYASRTAAVRRRHTLYAGNILPLVMDDRRSIDIDTADDWALAEAILAAGLPPDPWVPAPAETVKASQA